MSISFNLEIAEVETVVAGLRKLPMELIKETVNKIKIKAIPQIQSQQAAAQETAEPQPEVPVKQTNLTE
jgi:hypothetical protein